MITTLLQLENGRKGRINYEKNVENESKTKLM